MNVHIVVKGDTLWKIARQYGISFDELKKVNAHLANPDYIVPGMKIFLPEGGKTAKPHGGQPPKEKVPHAEKPVKPQQPAVPPVPPVPKPAPPAPETKPEPPRPAPKPEVKPAPKPKPPTPAPAPKPEVKPQPKPTPKPEAKPKPETKPQPKPTPPLCEMPPAPLPQPQPPMIQPMVIGIPCGWMPIYDADCHPHAHPYPHHPLHQQHPQHDRHDHHHHQPAPQQPSIQYPMVPPSMPQEMTRPPHWSVLPETPSVPHHEADESPVMPGQCPGISPSHDGHAQTERPSHKEPTAESPEFDLIPPAYCPPESGYIPQQQPSFPPQGIQAAQHPNYMHLCTSCGGQMSPFPYYGNPYYMAPMPYMPASGMPMYGPADQDPMGRY